jgi:hypothetical protein
MPSPDFSNYVSLTPYDAQPIEIYQAAVEYATTSMPDFQPRTGTVEDAMLQAMSYVSGFIVASINRLPDSLMQGIINIFGFERNEATLSSGTVVLNLLGDAGKIYAGTQFSYEEIVEGTTYQYVFISTEDVSISLGETSKTINVIGSTTGTIPTILANTELTVLTANSLIVSAVAGTITSGQDSEDDATYFTRAATYFQSLSNGLVTKRQIETFILNTYPVLTRVKSISPALLGITDSTKYDMAGVDLDDFLGHIIAYVLSTGSTFTEKETLVAIKDSIIEKSIPGLSVDISTPIFTKLASRTTIEKLSGYDTSTVRDSVATALTQYVSPANWDWSIDDISSAILSSIAIKNGTGVNYVYDMGLAVQGFKTACSMTPFGLVSNDSMGASTAFVLYDLASTAFYDDSFMTGNPYNVNEKITKAKISSTIYAKDGETEIALPSSFNILRKGYTIPGSGSIGTTVIRVKCGYFGHVERAELFKPGLSISGSGIPSNSHIVSLDNYSDEYYDLTISKALTTDLSDTTITIAATTAFTVVTATAGLDGNSNPDDCSYNIYEIQSIASSLSNGDYVTLELGMAHDFVIDDTIFVTGLKILGVDAYSPFNGKQTVSNVPSSTSITFQVKYDGDIENSFSLSNPNYDAAVFKYPNYSMSTLTVDFDIESNVSYAGSILNPLNTTQVLMTNYGYLPFMDSASTTVVVV